MSKDRVHDGKNYLIFNGVAVELEKSREHTKLYYDVLVNQYKQDRKEHNQLYKAHNESTPSLKGRNLRNSKATWVEGVFTFSEAFKHDLGDKYSFEELIEVASKCLDNVAAKVGGEIKYLVYHGDETTGHFHYGISNYDEFGKSLFHKINNTKDLSSLQDIAFNHFQKLGMDRGIKKDPNLKGLNWQDQKRYYELTINELRQEVKRLKGVHKEIANDVNLSNDEKKAMHDEVSKVQKELRSLDKELVQEKKNKEDFDSKVTADVNKILDYSKKTIGYDEKKLFKAISKKIKDYSNINTQLKENEALKVDNKALKDTNDKLLNDVDKKDKKILDLESLSDEKSREIKKLMQRDDSNKSFTDHEVAKVTRMYENDIKSLNNQLNEAKKDNTALKSANEKLEDFKEFVQEHHKEVIEDFEDQKKQRYMRNI